MALQRAEKRGDADAIEKAQEKYDTIQAELKGRQISGEYSLAAARIGKDSDYKDFMNNARYSPKFNTIGPNGKPVFDFEKAHQAYFMAKGTGGAKTGDQAYKDYLEGKMPDVPGGLTRNQFIQNYWSGEAPSSSGWGDLQVSK